MSSSTTSAPRLLANATEPSLDPESTYTARSTRLPIEYRQRFSRSPSFRPITTTPVEAQPSVVRFTRSCTNSALTKDIGAVTIRWFRYVEGSGRHSSAQRPIKSLPYRGAVFRTTPIAAMRLTAESTRSDHWRISPTNGRRETAGSRTGQSQCHPPCSKFCAISEAQ